MNKKKLKAWIGALALLLAAMIALGVIAWGSDWFMKKPSDWFRPDDPAAPAGELPVEVVETSGIQMRVLAAEEKVEQYIMLHIEPERAADKGVNWSFEWENPAGAWATGKAATDYLEYRDAGNLTWPGHPAIAVSAKQGFSEPIVATAVSQDNPAVRATCKIGYYNELIGFEGSFFLSDAKVVDFDMTEVKTIDMTRADAFTKSAYQGAGVTYSEIGTKKELSNRGSEMSLQLPSGFTTLLTDKSIVWKNNGVVAIVVGETYTVARIFELFFDAATLGDAGKYNDILDCLGASGGVLATVGRTVYGKRGTVTAKIGLKLDANAYDYKVTGFAADSDTEIYL